MRIMWVRLRLVYFPSVYKRHDRLTDGDPLSFVGPPLLSGKYLTTLINIYYTQEEAACEACDRGMFTSRRNVYRLQQDVNRQSM